MEWNRLHALSIFNLQASKTISFCSHSVLILFHSVLIPLFFFFLFCFEGMATQCQGCEEWGWGFGEGRRVVYRLCSILCPPPFGVLAMTVEECKEGGWGVGGRRAVVLVVV